ncbi:MAG: hypothetical protein H0X17_00010 [Deltaproteobacteria bacterium]|nr:hypothetical protein [Deltaproteobacteria bacterium]
MKKLTIMFALVAMTTLGAAGCKKKTDDAAKTDTAAKTTDTKATTTTTTTTTTGTPATAAAGDLPAECSEYKSMIEKLAACDKMPQQSRDALKQSYDAMSAGWANVGAMPPESKKAMTDTCKQGTEALKAAAGAQCGW